MVEVRIREDGRGRPSSFFASGHAGWAEDGEDVVCSTVETAALAIERLAAQFPDHVRTDREPGDG